MNAKGTQFWAARALAVASVVLGVTGVGLGAWRQAAASGGGGQCSGQILEIKQPDGSWKKTNANCSGSCPPPANPQHRTTCDLANLDPAFIDFGVKTYAQKKCACIETDLSGTIVHAVQMDGGTGVSSSCCDARSHWSIDYPYGFFNAVCSGSCSSPTCSTSGGTCGTNDPQYILPSARVTTCSCP